MWPWRSTLCSLVQSARHERGGGIGCAPTSFLVFKFTFVVIPDIHCAILRSSPTLLEKEDFLHGHGQKLLLLLFQLCRGYRSGDGMRDRGMLSPALVGRGL